MPLGVFDGIYCNFWKIFCFLLIEGNWWPWTISSSVFLKIPSPVCGILSFRLAVWATLGKYCWLLGMVKRSSQMSPVLLKEAADFDMILSWAHFLGFTVGLQIILLFFIIIFIKHLHGFQLWRKDLKRGNASHTECLGSHDGSYSNSQDCCEPGCCVDGKVL